jgi:hypothetical protein
MTTTARRVGNGLVNRAPVQCPICARYVATFSGIPVMMDDQTRIIYFAHADCCPGAERLEVTEPTV